MTDSPQKFTARRGFELFFFFCVVFTGYLFLKSPAVNTPQLVFRITMLTIGVIGSGAMLAWRLSEQSKKPE